MGEVLVDDLLAAENIDFVRGQTGAVAVAAALLAAFVVIVATPGILCAGETQSLLLSAGLLFLHLFDFLALFSDVVQLEGLTTTVSPSSHLGRSAALLRGDVRSMALVDRRGSTARVWCV